MPNKSHHRKNTLPYHKVGCKCNACKGKTQTLAGGTGAGGPAVAPEAPESQSEGVIHADGLPTVYTRNTSPRARILEIVSWRSKGYNLKETAEKMGLAYSTVRNLVYHAAKDGWLKFEDPYERFQHQIMPHVVDNIDYWIKKKDKTMTIEAAKGGGVFRSHQAVHMDGEMAQAVLNLKIEAVPPTAANEQKVVMGRIVGTPKRLGAGNESE